MELGGSCKNSMDFTACVMYSLLLYCRFLQWANPEHIEVKDMSKVDDSQRRARCHYVSTPTRLKTGNCATYNPIKMMRPKFANQQEDPSSRARSCQSKNAAGGTMFCIFCTGFEWLMISSPCAALHYGTSCEMCPLRWNCSDVFFIAHSLWKKGGSFAKTWTHRSICKKIKAEQTQPDTLMFFLLSADGIWGCDDCLGERLKSQNTPLP